VSEQRKWILGILAAFLFGIAGGAVGAVGVVAFLHHRGSPPPFMAGGPGFGHGGPGLGPGGPRHMGLRGERRPPMERIVTRHLDLSDEQRATIEDILDAARPRYAALRESTRAEIDRVLTPEQRTKLEEFEDRFPAPRRDEPDAP
jgi:Spy/CpxP family protein refolding chaperone